MNFFQVFFAKKEIDQFLGQSEWSAGQCYWTVRSSGNSERED
jgi:hypothetical protein